MPGNSASRNRNLNLWSPARPAYAVAEIEKAAGISGIPFEGRTVVLKEQVASFFEVTLRTVENYLEQNAEELARNGYEVLSGKRLQQLKLAIRGLDVPETEFGNITKAPQLGGFEFRAFLNFAMLMRESERAGLLRKAILDIVIDTINRRTGGGTKYINQRDEDFLHSAYIEENYRKQFTDALKDCVAMGNFKYAVYTDKIYVSIFREKKDLLGEWMSAVLRGDEDDESLKLKIFQAIDGANE